MNDTMQEVRIRSVLGGEKSRTAEQDLDRFFQHLEQELALPALVRGKEDFGWEEQYIYGSGDPDEYESRRANQPSFQDVFELMSIAQGVHSEWKLADNDIGAQVRRQSDGEEFWLGLSELEMIDRSSPNSRRVNDYSFWFFNRYQGYLR